MQMNRLFSVKTSNCTDWIQKVWPKERSTAWKQNDIRTRKNSRTPFISIRKTEDRGRQKIHSRRSKYRTQNVKNQCRISCPAETSPKQMPNQSNQGITYRAHKRSFLPGEWIIPNWTVLVIISPLSPPTIVGFTVSRYTICTTSAQSIGYISSRNPENTI